MIRFFALDRLSWKLGISVAALVTCAFAAGFYLVYRHYWRDVILNARSHAMAETRLIRIALEHQMLQNDRSLIREMVSSFAIRPRVERVMVLDRSGQVQFTSDSSIQRGHFKPDSTTCLVCHRHPPEDRSRTTTLEMDGGSVLRCVEPIPNQRRCHGCHDPDHRINGVLIVDVPLEDVRQGLERKVGFLAVGTGLIGLVLLVGIGLVFRYLVMRRLFRFESTARAIAEGDLQRRVPLRGNDALTRVESQFNRMTDSVVGLLNQLEDQRASLENVINSVDDGMVVLDRSLRVTAANEAFVRRFGGTATDLVGRRCCAGDVPGQDGFCTGEGECPAVRCMEEGTVQMTVRTRAVPDGTGTVKQEEVRASPVQAADGRIAGCVEVWRDITDRRSAEARLADYQRLASLGMLASGFSHEVNTPLASIRICLDGIARLTARKGELGRQDLEEINRCVRIAAEQVSRCGGITEQFLKLARGKSLTREIVNLGAVVEAVVRLVEPTAKGFGVGILVEDRPPLPSVLANEAAVQQVMLNILLNALEASRPCQAVRVSFLAGEEAAEVRVHNTGAVIAPEDLSRIFDPFFTRREKGTGLGLFVSLNLARSWGGDIRVSSKPEEGTTFEVVFPLDAP